MYTKLERIKKDIETMGRFNATPGKGLTRFSYTPEDRGAREYIKGEMLKVGLKVYEDAVGNIIGRIEGILKYAPTIIIGSHFDSVKNGGNFDGPSGVVMALEIARVIHENDMKLKYPIEFIAIVEEEGGRFGGGLFGSRAMVGKVTREELDTFKDDSDISIAEAMRAFGLNPDRIQEAVRKPRDIKAFIELHIEQGPVLEATGKEIGIVDYIVGIKQLEVIVKGQPDHAGTTPMTMRSDALDAASTVISEVSGFAKEAGEGTVATVGVLTLLPGAPNIVPGQVKFVVDIRSRKSECINQVCKEIMKSLEKVSEVKGVQYDIENKLYVEPTQLSKKIMDCFIENCKKLNLSSEIMLSGAGHDAMMIENITDVGLIFVPSKGGRSHCPEEWTDYEDLQKGIELVYHTILDIGGGRVT